MQRVSRDDARVLSLETLLRPAEPASANDVAADRPDPAARIAEERERIFDNARDAGYAEGMARAEADIAEAVARAEQAIERANAQEAERLQRANARIARLLDHLPLAIADGEARMEESAIEIAYAAALRLLERAHAERALVASLCRQALDDYAQRPATLHVAPSDLDEVAAATSDPAVRVEADPRLEAGRVRLTTHKGMYETSLAARLEAMTQAFLRAIAEAGGTRP